VSEPLCPVCKRTHLDTAACKLRRTCDACAIELGLYAFGPPQRPAGPCRRCGWHQIVRARVPEAYSRDGQSDTLLRPLALAYRTTRGPLTSEHVPDGGIGKLEAYVCRACGYTELYCVGADALPIGPQHGTELLEYASDTPFR